MFEITRLDPFGTRAMRDLLGTITNDPFFASAPTLPQGGSFPIDVSEVDDAIIVRASMPGMTNEDIDVQVHNGVLAIKGEHIEEKETEGERFYQKERHVGTVSRQIALPGVVAEGKATADLKDGVLTIRIPRSEEARPKRIAVQS